MGSGGTFDLDPLPLDLNETNEFFKSLPSGIENIKLKVRQMFIMDTVFLIQMIYQVIQNLLIFLKR